MPLLLPDRSHLATLRIGTHGPRRPSESVAGWMRDLVGAGAVVELGPMPFVTVDGWPGEWMIARGPTGSRLVAGIRFIDHWGAVVIDASGDELTTQRPAVLELLGMVRPDFTGDTVVELSDLWTA